MNIAMNVEKQKHPSLVKDVWDDLGDARRKGLKWVLGIATATGLAHQADQHLNDGKGKRAIFGVLVEQKDTTTNENDTISFTEAEKNLNEKNSSDKEDESVEGGNDDPPLTQDKDGDVIYKGNDNEMKELIDEFNEKVSDFAKKDLKELSNCLKKLNLSDDEVQKYWNDAFMTLVFLFDLEQRGEMNDDVVGGRSSFNERPCEEEECPSFYEFMKYYQDGQSVPESGLFTTETQTETTEEDDPISLLTNDDAKEDLEETSEELEDVEAEVQRLEQELQDVMQQENATREMIIEAAKDYAKAGGNPADAPNWEEVSKKFNITPDDL